MHNFNSRYLRTSYHLSLFSPHAWTSFCVSVDNFVMHSRHRSTIEPVSSAMVFIHLTQLQIIDYILDEPVQLTGTFTICTSHFLFVHMWTPTSSQLCSTSNLSVGSHMQWVEKCCMHQMFNFNYLLNAGIVIGPSEGGTHCDDITSIQLIALLRLLESILLCHTHVSIRWCHIWSDKKFQIVFQLRHLFWPRVRSRLLCKSTKRCLFKFFAGKTHER